MTTGKMIIVSPKLSSIIYQLSSPGTRIIHQQILYLFPHNHF